MRIDNTLYKFCGLCPRECGVDRAAGEKGRCGMTGKLTAAAAVLHKGEEPVLTGTNGSGTVFFSGCGLACFGCQNCGISSGEKAGAVLNIDELSRIMLELETKGAANINLVTGGHFAPSIIPAVLDARERGLSIPVVWNSSGYETAGTLSLLEEVVDIWLPDLKTLDKSIAQRLFSAPDYPEKAAAALLFMAEAADSRGGVIVKKGIMQRGLIVRHLVIPGEIEASRDVLRWYSENLKDRALLSLMVQYTAADAAGREIAGPDYIISDGDYDFLMNSLYEFGIDEGFIQEPEAADSGWIPDFHRKNPFPEDYSIPVWHWRYGLIKESV